MVKEQRLADRRKRAKSTRAARRTMQSRYRSLYGWTLVVFLIFSPFSVYGALRAVESNQNQVDDWLPASFKETGELAWYKEHFAGDQFILISWEGCRIDGAARDSNEISPDPRIDQLANLLVSSSPVGGRPQSPPYNTYFQSVVTGPRMLEYMTGAPSNLNFALAKKRLTGSLIGSDECQTCLVVTLANESLDDIGAVLSRPAPSIFGFNYAPGVIFEALEACGVSPDEAKIGGPPVDNIAIDEEGERSFIRLVGISGLLGLALSWMSLRSVRHTLIVFACGLLSATSSLTTLWIAGGTTDAIVLSMPPLVYVLAISGAIHLINYYREVIEEVGALAAPAKAMRLGWKPALYCSLTTALGLLSLCTSDITPIRKFGIYSAVGVLEMLVVLFLFLPAALYTWPQPRERLPKSTKPMAHGHQATDDFRDSLGQVFWRKLGMLMIRRHAVVTVVFAVLLLALAAGLKHFKTSIDLMKLFDSKARILNDYQWLESHIGCLVPVELVVSFSPDSIAPFDNGSTPIQSIQWSLLARARMVAQVQGKIEATFGSRGTNIIGPSVSALTFIPPLPQQDRSVGAVLHRRAMDRKLESAYESIVKSGYLAIDKTNGSELWRISIRVAAFKNVDYGQFSEALSQLVDPTLHGFANSRQASRASVVTDSVNELSDAERAPSVKAVYTGVIPIVYKAQTALLSSLVSSTIWSFVTITPLLMFVSRGILAGIVAMIPNVLPILAVFGGLSWLGVPIDIGTMMAASIALGVAVDDTIHYLTWFRISLEKDGDRHVAILSAYRHCATPTIQATLINGLGLSIFTLSSFVPTKQLGFLMLVILFAGAVAELLLLPAILAGPLGCVFVRSKSN